MNRSRIPLGFFPFLLLFPALFLPVPARAQERKGFVRPGPLPRIVVDPTEIDLGEMLTGERFVRKVKISNRGEGPLMLLKIQITCGCTIPHVVMPDGRRVVPDPKGERPIGVLEPGEQAELNLEYFSGGQSGKIKDKWLALHSNDPREREVKIRFKGEVKPAFEFEPRFIDFGAVPRGHTRSRSAIVRSIRAGPFRIKEIRTEEGALPPFLTASVAPLKKAVPPACRVTLSLDAGAPLGSTSLGLKLLLENPRVEECMLRVHFEVVPNVTFLVDGTRSRDELDFKVLPYGRGATKVIEIVNHDPSVPYVIKKVSFSSKYAEDFEIHRTTMKEGEHYRIAVTVKPELDRRFFRGVLTITSDHPDLPEKKITVKGWISKH